MSAERTRSRGETARHLRWGVLGFSMLGAAPGCWGETTPDIPQDIPCALDGDCVLDNPCLTGVCVEELCVFSGVDYGTPVEDPEDEPGDCLQAVCDGEGAIALVADDTDPNHDGYGCTEDICNDGTPAFVALAPGSPCGSGNAVCHADGRCDSCPEPDMACTDTGPGEPNDTSTSAHSYGKFSDDDVNAQAFCGLLTGSESADWYTYEGIDEAFSVVDPTVSVDKGTGLRVCQYFQCVSGKASFTCADGSSPDQSPAGLPGCCHDTSFTIDLSCAGTLVDDDARVWIRVDNPSGLLCAPYELHFHY